MTAVSSGPTFQVMEATVAQTRAAFAAGEVTARAQFGKNVGHVIARRRDARNAREVSFDRQQVHVDPQLRRHCVGVQRYRKPLA